MCRQKSADFGQRSQRSTPFHPRDARGHHSVENAPQFPSEILSATDGNRIKDRNQSKASFDTTLSG
jgi:hypothetical protein